MPDKHEVLRRLVAMSRDLGQPEKDYVILSEGNTSARIDETTFWVKAVADELKQWGMIVFAMALVLGFANILRVNLKVIRRRGRDWQVTGSFLVDVPRRADI